MSVKGSTMRMVWVLIVGWAGYGSASAGGSGLHFERSDYSSGAGGAQAVWLNAADLDGDGRLDLCAANGTSNTLGVLLSAGGGSFLPASEFSTLNAPNAVALGDLDGDGAIDALVGHGAAARTLLLKGDGAGGLSPLNALSADFDSRTVLVRDFDLDGSLDVATANYTSRTVRVAFNADGFAQPVDVFLGPAPTHLDAGDLDNDGDVDLVAAVADSGQFAPSIVENLGAGAFGLAPGPALTGIPAWIAIGDVSNDGILDVTAPSDDGVKSLLEVALGNGDLSFSTLFFAVAVTQMQELGDFDGDGRLDYVYEHFSLGTGVNLGNGAGGTAEHGIPTGAPKPLHIAVFDFDGDGRDDFATANGSGGLSVLLSRLGAQLHAEFTDSQAELSLVADAGNFFALFASPDLLPSSAPGLVDLDIGASFSSLFLLNSGVLGASGEFDVSYSLSNLPLGLELHFQGATLESSGAAPPLAVTNVASGTVGG